MADFISCNSLRPGRGWERVHNYGLLSSTSKVNKSKEKMCRVMYCKGRHVASVKFMQGSAEGLPHCELPVRSGQLKCIKSVFEILSAKQSLLMQSKKAAPVCTR